MCTCVRACMCACASFYTLGMVTHICIIYRTIRRENLSVRLLFTKKTSMIVCPLSFELQWNFVSGCVCLTVCDACRVIVIFFSVCSHVAGLTAVLVTYPLDVVRSRVAFQVKAASVEVGMREMVRLMRSTEGGMKPFYRGMVPSVLGMAPYSGQCMRKKTVQKKHNDANTVIGMFKCSCWWCCFESVLS